MQVKHQFEDIHNFRRLKYIDNGSFSTIYTVEDKKSGNVYAAKCLIPMDNKYQSEMRIPHEFKIMFHLSHPAILKVYGLSHLDFDDEPNPIIILEYMPNGSFKNVVDQLQNSTAPTFWNHTKLLINLYGIASGMLYLHSNNILHCDLNPGNVLLDSNYYPRIADCGFSVSLEPGQSEIKFDRLRGMSLFISPEKYQSLCYSKKGDVYSFGIIMFSLFRNFHWEDNTFLNVIGRIVKGERPEFTAPTPNCYKDLITRCWAQDPNDRPTFEEIVHMLSTNRDFITELGDVDESEFYYYVDMLNGKKPLIDNQIELQAMINEEIEEEPLSIQVPPFDLNNYDRQRKIGEGAFGVVYEVKDK